MDGYDEALEHTPKSEKEQARIFSFFFSANKTLFADIIRKIAKNDHAISKNLDLTSPFYWIKSHKG